MRVKRFLRVHGRELPMTRRWGHLPNRVFLRRGIRRGGHLPNVLRHHGETPKN